MTWSIAVVDGTCRAVAEAIASHDARAAGAPPTCGTHSYIGNALQSLEPLGLSDKLLVAATRSGTACLFANGFFLTSTEYAAWSILAPLSTRALSIKRCPTTISEDERSGVWGIRELILRDATTPFGAIPVLSVSVVDDGGRWRFFRYGEPQWFEDHEGYNARATEDRLTDETLLKCAALGAPVYDSSWYTGEAYIVPMKSVMERSAGFTYAGARDLLRIDLGAHSEGGR